MTPVWVHEAVDHRGVANTEKRNALTTANDAPAKKTAAKKQLSGQIHPQRQVLSEHPAQHGVHRMRGCDVAAASVPGRLTELCFGGVGERVRKLSRGSREGHG